MRKAFINTRSLWWRIGNCRMAAGSFMRFRFALSGLALIAAGEASASSFVTVAPPAPEDTPSIVVLGTQTRAVQIAQASQSDAMVLPPLSYPGTSLEPRDQAPDSGTMLSPSIVALGQPATELPVADDDVVAAIPKAKPKPRPFRGVSHMMVIRGGIAGDPFRAAPAEPAEVAEGGALPPNAEAPAEPVAPDPAARGAPPPLTRGME